MLCQSKIEELLRHWNPTVECCGIILKDLTILSLKNHHPAPELGFRMNWQEYEQYAQDMLATWHTHPSGSANLSMPDFLMFKAQPNWFHYIVGCGKVWGYKVQASKVLLHETHSIPRTPE